MSWIDIRFVGVTICHLDGLSSLSESLFHLLVLTVLQVSGCPQYSRPCDNVAGCNRNWWVMVVTRDGTPVASDRPLLHKCKNLFEKNKKTKSICLTETLRQKFPTWGRVPHWWSMVIFWWGMQYFARGFFRDHFNGVLDLLHRLMV